MRLANLFTDHLVLQRDRPIPVWGWAAPGEAVTVELAGKSARATAAADGRWQARLPALPAGGPHQLIAHGKGTATVEDVLIGEVWVCSGQSNMEWPLEMSTGADQVLAQAELPNLRLFTVPKRTALKLETDVEAAWTVSSADSAARFSAVGFHFGRELLHRLDVPIGLINTSWGGTPAQAWTSLTGLRSEPALAGYLEQLRDLDLPAEEIRARAKIARAQFLKQLPQDTGNRGFTEGWAGIEFNDHAWKTMKLPDYWINAGHPTNGVFWFRKTVDLPAAWAGKKLQLSLGAVDKSDDTYVNGQRVGGMNWADEPQSWSTPRNYTVPAGLLKAGRNVIAVRAVSNFTGGGLTGPGSSMVLHGPADGSDKPLPLAGNWRYAIEQDFGRVTGIAEPQSMTDHHTPTLLFNGMIAPLIPYAIRGAIWYQGESNAGDAKRYRTLFPTMIQDWRRCWQQGDFPFYFVQLADYGSLTPATESDDSRWAELRAAQAATRELPNTGMAVTIDIGEPADIHPRNKRDVGLRLAYNALAQIHAQQVPFRGPTYRAHTVTGAEMRIELDHADGLRARDGAVRGFAVAGADRRFYPAIATLDGNAVRLRSQAVASPVAARYGWADAPVCTLQNGAGLPAEPFRTDDWPVGPKTA